MRTGIEIEVSVANRARLEAIVADRNSPQKHVWRAGDRGRLRHRRDHAPGPEYRSPAIIAAAKRGYQALDSIH